MAVDERRPLVIHFHQLLMGLTRVRFIPRSSACSYTGSAAGSKQLTAERTEFDRTVGAIHRVLGTT
jgi:hypothetical protein